MNTDFKSLHIVGDPLVLYNIWDAGSAMAVAKSNPPAIATGSWAMAASQGFAYGETMPFTRFADTVAQIIGAVKIPVTVDFETGFGDDLLTLRTNIERLVALGVIGVNFEDRIIGTKDLRNIDTQCERIKVLRDVSNDLFINARCDLMFDGADAEVQETRIDDLLERAHAYADAGGDCLFVPGLSAPNLIEVVCQKSPLPVNIMRMNKATVSDLASLGVARISHGPKPYLDMMKALSELASGA